MSQICHKMNGAKCAESFCDLWDLEEKRCSEAVVNEKKSEILDILIEKISEIKVNEGLRTKIVEMKDIVFH